MDSLLLSLAVWYSHQVIKLILKLNSLWNATDMDVHLNGHITRFSHVSNHKPYIGFLSHNRLCTRLLIWCGDFSQGPTSSLNEILTVLHQKTYDYTTRWKKISFVNDMTHCLLDSCEPCFTQLVLIRIANSEYISVIESPESLIFTFVNIWRSMHLWMSNLTTGWMVSATQVMML